MKTLLKAKADVEDFMLPIQDDGYLSWGPELRSELGITASETERLRGVLLNFKGDRTLIEARERQLPVSSRGAMSKPQHSRAGRDNFDPFDAPDVLFPERPTTMTAAQQFTQQLETARFAGPSLLERLENRSSSSFFHSSAL